MWLFWGESVPAKRSPRSYEFVLSTDALEGIEAGGCEKLLSEVGDALEFVHFFLGILNHILVGSEHRDTDEGAKGWDKEEGLFEPLKSTPAIRALDIREVFTCFREVRIEVWVT